MEEVNNIESAKGTIQGLINELSSNKTINTENFERIFYILTLALRGEDKKNCSSS